MDFLHPLLANHFKATWDGSLEILCIKIQYRDGCQVTYGNWDFAILRDCSKDRDLSSSEADL